METEPRAITCVTFKTLGVKWRKCTPVSAPRVYLLVWITNVMLSEDSSVISRLINRSVLRIHTSREKNAINHTYTGFVNWARISGTGPLPVRGGQPRCANHFRGRWLMQRIWSYHTFLFASALIGISERGDTLSPLFSLFCIQRNCIRSIWNSASVPMPLLVSAAYDFKVYFLGVECVSADCVCSVDLNYSRFLRN